MIDLNELTQAVGDLEEEQVMEMLNEFIKSSPESNDAAAVVAACQAGMSIVGDLFEKEEYFVADLIFAGELLTEALTILKPVMGTASGPKVGSIVLATVKGDLHDIGKNIFKGMAEAAGFVVYDLGFNQPARAFVDKVKEVKPDIVGMSAVLTLALDSMRETIVALEEAGLRKDLKVIIGGVPVTANACESVGADAFTSSAAEGVKIIKEWVR